MHIWMQSLTKNVPLPQEEKRKMKEEIERRRAEAAEKRQKVEDTMDGEEKPFKCVSPRGSSLKVGLPFLLSPPSALDQSCFIFATHCLFAHHPP